MVSGNGFPQVLSRAIEGPLSQGEARSVAEEMLSGNMGDLEIASLLVALRARGEAPGEIAGFAEALRSRAVKPPIVAGKLLDTAGTGGDGSGSLNASTAAALIASFLGARVAKHGNRSVTSRSGSADFLEALGYPVEMGPQAASCALERSGFAFLFAPRYHPLMARVMPVRRRLGIRTVFNLAGPLSNPFTPVRQVLGVASPGLLGIMAKAGERLGYERLVVVHGEPGVDEVSVFGSTKVLVVEGGMIEKMEFQTRELGLGQWRLEDVRVKGPQDSAGRFLRVIEGEGRGPDVDFIAANAGMALFAYGLAGSPEEGVSKALDSLAGGGFPDRLRKVVEVARECLGRE